MLDAIKPWVDQISFREPVVMTYDVDLDNGVIGSEEWNEIDDILMDFM